MPILSDRYLLLRRLQTAELDAAPKRLLFQTKNATAEDTRGDNFGRQDYICSKHQPTFVSSIIEEPFDFAYICDFRLERSNSTASNVNIEAIQGSVPPKRRICRRSHKDSDQEPNYRICDRRHDWIYRRWSFGETHDLPARDSTSHAQCGTTGTYPKVGDSAATCDITIVWWTREWSASKAAEPSSIIAGIDTENNETIDRERLSSVSQQDGCITCEIVAFAFRKRSKTLLMYWHYSLLFKSERSSDVSQFIHTSHGVSPRISVSAFPAIPPTSGHTSHIFI